MPLALEPILLSVAIVLAGGFFRGFAGFGGGLLMAPLLTLVHDPEVVVPMLLVIALIGDARLLPEVWRGVDFRRVGWLVGPSVVGLPIGIYALATLDGEIVRRVVSGIVLAMVLLLGSGLRFRGAERRRVLAPAGFVGGTLSGIGGVGGPPVVLTLLSLDEPPAKTRATLIAYFAMSGAVALVMMLGAGVLDAESGKLSAICAVPYFVAIHFGSRRFAKSNADSYRPIALTFLGCVALFGLLWPT